MLDFGMSKDYASAEMHLDIPQSPYVLNDRHRVWIIVGGDGAERNLSMKSGLNIYLKLR